MIVGIDLGTRMGYCVMDLERNIQESGAIDLNMPKRIKKR